MKTINIKRTLNTSIENVWNAITEKELMKRWYFDLSEFKPEIGFKFSFFGGPSEERQYKHICEIMEVIPHKKIVHTWNYDGYEGSSLLTWELFEVDKNQTTVKITHSGIDTFPKSQPDFDIKNFEIGWDYLLNKSLVGFLEK